MNHSTAFLVRIGVTAALLWPAACGGGHPRDVPGPAGRVSPPPSSSRPSTQPEDPTATMIVQIRNDQLQWMLARERFGLLGGEGPLELPPGSGLRLRGAIANVLQVIEARKDDVNFIERHLLPPLLRALDDPSSFAAAHLILCKLFDPRGTQRHIERPAENTLVLVEDGLRIVLTQQEPEGASFGHIGDTEYNFYPASATYDPAQIPALKNWWEQRQQQGRLFGHF